MASSVPQSCVALRGVWFLQWALVAAGVARSLHSCLILERCSNFVETEYRCARLEARRRRSRYQLLIHLSRIVLLKAL